MQDRRALLAGWVAATAVGASAPALGRVTPRAGMDPNRAGETDRSQLPPCVANRDVEAPNRSFNLGQFNSTTWHSLSPDGATLLVRDYQTLWFVPLDGEAATSVPLAGPAFGLTGAEGSLMWASDSESIWLVAGETNRSGFVTRPVHIARRYQDGRLSPTPPLRDPPGRLDRVFWLDGEGLGLAQFDMRGGSHRPELPNPRPSLGIVEAGTGRIRTVVEVSAFRDPWGALEGLFILSVQAVSKTADGRVRVVLNCVFAESDGSRSRTRGLLMWTEGEEPTVLPNDLVTPNVSFAFGRNAESLLVGFPLSASGVIIEGAPSPPPTPHTGRYAALCTLEGRVMWTLSGTAHHMRGNAQPIVSPDGRYALLLLPDRCGTSALMGVIDLEEGRIKRRLLLPHGHSVSSAGFHREKPWVAIRHMFDMFE